MAEWERCESNDPRRCQASGQYGQCPYKSVPEQKYCPRHMSQTENLAAKKAANQYRLQQYQERVAEFATSDELKNLRGEIGILRMMLEQTINICGDDKSKLMCYSGRISDMVTRISALIKTCHHLDVKMGMMLDRDKVMLIGQAIVELVAEVVPDQSILDDLGEKLVSKILEIAGQ
jgi:hypothetical protein